MTELVLDELLPKAADGLDRFGVAPAEPRPAARHHRAALPYRPQRRGLADRGGLGGRAAPRHGPGRRAAPHGAALRRAATHQRARAHLARRLTVPAPRGGGAPQRAGVECGGEAPQWAGVGVANAARPSGAAGAAAGAGSAAGGLGSAGSSAAGTAGSPVVADADVPVPGRPKRPAPPAGVRTRPAPPAAGPAADPLVAAAERPAPTPAATRLRRRGGLPARRGGRPPPDPVKASAAARPGEGVAVARPGVGVAAARRRAGVAAVRRRRGVAVGAGDRRGLPPRVARVVGGLAGALAGDPHRPPGRGPSGGPLGEDGDQDGAADPDDHRVRRDQVGRHLLRADRRPACGTPGSRRVATSSGPAAPEAAAPTRCSGSRAARRAARAPITSAEPRDSSAPGQ